MRLALGPPSHWHVVLSDGSTVDVWADGYSGSDDEDQDYEFSVMVDVAPGDQTEYEVSPHALPIRDGVMATVVRFPRASVSRIYSA